MREAFIAILMLGLIVACDGGVTTPSVDSVGSTVPQINSTGAAAITPETTESPIPSASDPATTAAQDPEPSYEVFLAAVAEAVVNTRFAEVPFDEPEITVATGLALCEAIANGETPNDVIIEFLADMTEGQPTEADNDELILTGALIGAAESALCPPDL